MSKSRLILTQKDAPSLDTNDDLFVIEDQLQQVSTETFDEYYRRLANGEMEDVAGFSLYGLLSSLLSVPFPQTTVPDMSLTELLVLYDVLETTLDKGDIDCIECHDIQDNYAYVAVDVASTHGVEIENSPVGPGKLKAFVSGVFFSAVIFVDVVLSFMFRSRLCNNTPASTFVLAHANRFHCIEPVLDEFESSYDVVVPLPTLYWLYGRLRGDYEEIAAHDPIPIGALATPEVMKYQLYVLWKFVVAVFRDDALEASLRGYVSEKFDVPLEKSVAYVVSNVYRTHLKLSPHIILAGHSPAIRQYDSVVISSLSPLARSLLRNSSRSNTPSYHVPHTITTGYEVVPREDTVHIVSSQSDFDHLEQSTQVSETTTIVPLGRPHLIELRRQRADHRCRTSGPLKITIATQPFDDHIRRSFVESVLESIRIANIEVTITIKIHPNENKSFYRRYRSDETTIATANLEQHLIESDVVVTINSNVGIESVAYGTACVTVNLWTPIVRSRPYALQGPIPVLRERRAIDKYFEELSLGEVKALNENQQRFFEEQYISGHSASGIANYIETGQRPEQS